MPLYGRLPGHFPWDCSGDIWNDFRRDFKSPTQTNGDFVSSFIAMRVVHVRCQQKSSFVNLVPWPGPRTFQVLTKRNAATGNDFFFMGPNEGSLTYFKNTTHAPALIAKSRHRIVHKMLKTSPWNRENITQGLDRNRPLSPQKQL